MVVVDSLAAMPERAGRPSSTLRIIAVGSALLALLFGYGVWSALGTDPREAAALRTNHSLLAVTLGDEPLILGSNWQKALLKANPALASKIGGTVLESKAAKPNSIVIWENYGLSDSGWSGPMPSRRFRCRDDFGNEWTQVVAVTPKDFEVHFNHRRIFPHAITNFPRRGKTIEITPLDWKGHPLPGGPVTVPNPLERDYDRWTLPDSQVARDGNLVGRISSVEPGGTRRTAFARIPLQRIRLTIDDPAGWKVLSIQFRDATGNSWTVTSQYSELASTISGGAVGLSYPKQDLSNEKILEVRLQLAPLRNVPRAERSVFSMVPVPRAKSLAAERRTCSIGGEEVRLTEQIGMGAQGTFTPSRGVYFRLNAPKPNEDRALLVRFPGSTLWEPPFYMEGSYLPNGEAYYAIVPEENAGERVSMEVALARTQALVFRIPTPD